MAAAGISFAAPFPRYFPLRREELEQQLRGEDLGVVEVGAMSFQVEEQKGLRLNARGTLFIKISLKNPAILA